MFHDVFFKNFIVLACLHFQYVTLFSLPDFCQSFCFVLLFSGNCKAQRFHHIVNQTFFHTVIDRSVYCERGHLIDFDQMRHKVRVDHDIESKDLET